MTEVRQLAEAGVFELNLVAQDSTSWGKDLPELLPGAGRPRLEDLVRALDAVEGPGWIRLLYLYPSAVSDGLIDAIAGARRVLPYVDVPLQHASDAVLSRMRRGTTGDRQRKLVERLRAGIPGLTLRTTFIVGFPGETDADFEELLEFVRWARFDRLGVFRYSDEEDTAGIALEGKVPREVARERYRRLTELQTELMAEGLERHVGSEVELLVDAPFGARGEAIARSAAQAPEIGRRHLPERDRLARGRPRACADHRRARRRRPGGRGARRRTLEVISEIRDRAMASIRPEAKARNRRRCASTARFRNAEIGPSGVQRDGAGFRDGFWARAAPDLSARSGR